MELTTIFLIGGIVLLAIFVLILRLAIRWAARLTIFGIILIALAGGALFWWWTSKLAAQPQRSKQHQAPRRRASSL